jgi:pyrroline-5-carboxylate reductase
MSLEGTRIGFIGAGAMAEALAGGLVASGVGVSALRLADPDPNRRKHVEQKLGLATTDDNATLVAESDLVVLAVKPQILPSVLAGLAGVDDRTRPLWVSIAAGVRIGKLEAALGPGARVVRARPNTPALVQSGAPATVGNDGATADDLGRATSLFTSVGTCWTAPR